MVRQSDDVLLEGEFTMSAIRYMDENILIKKGMELLIKELGDMEAVRFINLNSQKQMESVRRHREWQEKLDKNLFFDAVFSEQK